MLPNLLRRLEARPVLVLDVVRVYLGAGLLFRGVALVGSDSGLFELVNGSVLGVPLDVIVVYVTAAHIVGGILLIVGYYTRLAALIQLPILLGAVFLLHWQDGLLSANQSLEFSALVLYLLAIVFVFGSGPWSLDARWTRAGAEG